MCPKIFFTLVSHLTFSSFDRRQQVGITHPGAASHQVAKIFRQVQAFWRNIWRILYIVRCCHEMCTLRKKNWDKIDSFWGLDPWGVYESIREGWRYQIGWIFRNIPNGLRFIFAFFKACLVWFFSMQLLKKHSLNYEITHLHPKGVTLLPLDGGTGF